MVLFTGDISLIFKYKYIIIILESKEDRVTIKMTTADGRGKSHEDTLLPIILCLCFIGSSIIFLYR